MLHWTDFAGQEPELAEWAYARLALPAAFLATVRADSTGSGWVTLADPEGNEFCIVRSDEERALSSSP
jgi:hypothetical protein